MHKTGKPNIHCFSSSNMDAFDIIGTRDIGKILIFYTYIRPLSNNLSF